MPEVISLTYNFTLGKKNTPPVNKEETIAKNINELFKKKENKMIEKIGEAMYENGH